MKMPKVASLFLVGAFLATCALIPGCAGPTGDSADRPTRPEPLRGWLSWRGPSQDGTSPETRLPDRVSPDSEGSWTYPIQGRGTPVIANGRVYGMGYRGEGKEFQEILFCLEEASGRKIWEHGFTDFLTDSIYLRYAIGSPTVDPDTGNVLCMTTAGLLSCFAASGNLLWQRSMMSEYGRLTFPNGRTGAPLVVGDLTIVHVATSSWGKHAPARDRFYAFDKRTGEPIWSSTPGGPPKDSSFSFPVVATENGRQVVYAGLAGGHLVCVDVKTGDPVWRYQMATGGMSSSPLLYGDSIIAIHGKENLDDSTIGRMIRIKRGTPPTPGGATLERSQEVWRNALCAFTSSPVLVGNRVYQTVLTGDLCCTDADTGATIWHRKLAPDQIHASPAWGDGKLYVPMNNGTFHVVRPRDEGPEVLQTIQLAGDCLGAPAIANGRIYVHTTDRLYCFAGGQGQAAVAERAPRQTPDGPVVRLQVVPGDVLLVAGDTVPLKCRGLDGGGNVVSESSDGVTFAGLPDGVTIANGSLSTTRDTAPTAFVLRATRGDLSATSRVRIVPAIPFSLDFDDTALRPHPKLAGVQYAPPRPWWVGAMAKWEVRELDGGKVLAKTLINPLFQRTMSLIGHPRMSNYTVQADIRTDGNRRTMSSAGVVNQRYLIRLKGNHQQLEVSSNEWLLKESVRFRWRPKTWYRLKTRVDVQEDGSAIVRAKAWKRDDPEPDAWTIEVTHPNGHTHGPPGIFGFVPQSRFRSYLDNITVTENE